MPWAVGAAALGADGGWSEHGRRNGDRTGRREFDGEARRKALVGDSRALDAVETVAAVGVLVAVVGVEHDVAFQGAAKGIGFDRSRGALVEQVDARTVGGGEADDVEVALEGRPYLEWDRRGKMDDARPYDFLAGDVGERREGTRRLPGFDQARNAGNSSRSLRTGGACALMAQHLAPTAFKDAAGLLKPVVGRRLDILECALLAKHIEEDRRLGAGVDVSEKIDDIVQIAWPGAFAERPGLLRESLFVGVGRDADAVGRFITVAVHGGGSPRCRAGNMVGYAGG